MVVDKGLAVASADSSLKVRWLDTRQMRIGIASSMTMEARKTTIVNNLKSEVSSSMRILASLLLLVNDDGSKEDYNRLGYFGKFSRLTLIR